MAIMPFLILITGERFIFKVSRVARPIGVLPKISVAGVSHSKWSFQMSKRGLKRTVISPEAGSVPCVLVCLCPLQLPQANAKLSVLLLPSSAKGEIVPCKKSPLQSLYDTNNTRNTLSLCFLQNDARQLEGSFYSSF